MKYLSQEDKQKILNLFDFENPNAAIRKFEQSLIKNNIDDLSQALDVCDAFTLYERKKFIYFLNGFVTEQSYSLIKTKLFDGSVFANHSLRNIPGIIDRLKSIKTQGIFEKIKCAYLEQNLELLGELVSSKEGMIDIKKPWFTSFIKDYFYSKCFDFLYKEHLLDDMQVMEIFGFAKEINNCEWKAEQYNLIKKSIPQLYYLANNPDFIKKYNLFSKIGNVEKDYLINVSYGFSDLMFKSFVKSGLIPHKNILKYILSLSSGFYLLKDNEVNEYISLFLKACDDSKINEIKESLDRYDHLFFNKKQYIYLENIANALGNYQYLLKSYFILNNNDRFYLNNAKGFLSFCGKSNLLNPDDFDFITNPVRLDNLTCNLNYQDNNQNIKNIFDENFINICKLNLVNLLTYEPSLFGAFTENIDFNCKEVVNVLSKLLLSDNNSIELIIFAFRLGCPETVDKVISEIRPFLKENYSLLAGNSYKKELHEKIDIKGDLLLTYLASKFGSSHFLKEIFKDKKVVTQMLNSGIYDEVIDKRLFPENVLDVYRGALKNLINNQLMTTDRCDDNKRNKKLKI